MNLLVTQPQSMSKNSGQGTAALSRVLARMPREISAGFTSEQLGALDAALDYNNPTPHPVNLRVTLFGLFYLVVLAGPERRTPDRRAEERERYPLRSRGNIALLTVIAILGLALGYTLRSLILEG